MFLTIDDNIKEKEIVNYKGYIHFEYPYSKNVYTKLEKEFENVFLEEKKDNEEISFINKSYIDALLKLIEIGKSLNANALMKIRINIHNVKNKAYLHVEGLAYLIE